MDYINFVIGIFILLYGAPAILTFILAFYERWGYFNDMTVGDLISDLIINPLIPMWNMIIGYTYLCYLINITYVAIRDYKPFERLPRDGR